MKHPRTWTRPIALSLPLTSACDKPQQSAPQAVVQPVPAAPAPPPAAPAIPEPALRALVTSWTAAQNRGAFADYEKLYASKFMGVKRAGERVTQFTRESWLEDRKRMFAKPVSVEASDMVVHAAADSAEVSFTQRWASGSFADVGPKRLLIVRDGDALKIAQEEMLRSQLVKREPVAFDFHFTLRLKSGLYIRP